MFWRWWRKRAPAVGAELVGERAGRLFDGGMNCAQAVLQATTGSDDPKMMEIARAFGGGIGGSRCLCGAVSGGVMALGLGGRRKRAGELVAAFKARNRTTCCKGLSAGYAWMSREHKQNCRRMTTETAEVVARLLQG